MQRRLKPEIVKKRKRRKKETSEARRRRRRRKKAKKKRSEARWRWSGMNDDPGPRLLEEEL
jgi:hypothetical protein